MSGGLACDCPGTTTERKTQWEVWQRRCNHSAFNGYHYTPSDYSSVHCRRCQAVWRTNAYYVDALPDGRP